MNPTRQTISWRPESMLHGWERADGFSSSGFYELLYKETSPVAQRFCSSVLCVKRLTSTKLATTSSKFANMIDFGENRDPLMNVGCHDHILEFSVIKAVLPAFALSFSPISPLFFFTFKALIWILLTWGVIRSFPEYPEPVTRPDGSAFQIIAGQLSGWDSCQVEEKQAEKEKKKKLIFDIGGGKGFFRKQWGCFAAGFYSRFQLN